MFELFLTLTLGSLVCGTVIGIWMFGSLRSHRPSVIYHEV
jgi:hypothetical protein